MEPPPTPHETSYPKTASSQWQAPSILWGRKYEPNPLLLVAPWEDLQKEAQKPFHQELFCSSWPCDWAIISKRSAFLWKEETTVMHTSMQVAPELEPAGRCLLQKLPDLTEVGKLLWASGWGPLNLLRWVSCDVGLQCWRNLPLREIGGSQDFRSNSDPNWEFLPQKETMSFLGQCLLSSLALFFPNFCALFARISAVQETGTAATKTARFSH